MFAMVATRLLIATLAISECFPVFGGSLFSASKELRQWVNSSGFVVGDGDGKKIVGCNSNLLLRTTRSSEVMDDTCGD